MPLKKEEPPIVLTNQRGAGPSDSTPECCLTLRSTVYLVTLTAGSSRITAAALFVDPVLSSQSRASARLWLIAFELGLTASTIYKILRPNSANRLRWSGPELGLCYDREPPVSSFTSTASS